MKEIFHYEILLHHFALFSLFVLQGTIMALSAFTMPDAVEMIEAAALLCPISYLDHITSRFVLRAVSLHLDQVTAVCYEELKEIPLILSLFSFLLQLFIS